MKNLLTLLCLLYFVTYQANAQQVQDVASRSIQEAIPLAEKLIDIKETIKLVGIGDIAEYAKESKKVTTALAAYLIVNKNFRNLLVSNDDWEVRPLNSYLTSKDTSSVSLDQLVKSTFPYGTHKYRNREFTAFLKWLKQYNLSHPADMVNISGVAPNSVIPPSYFLANYVYPIDESFGKQLSEKWGNNATPDKAAYIEIETWAAGLKDAKLSKKQRSLSDLCLADIQHNKAILILTSLDQKFPPAVINARSKYMADLIISKLDKKTIYLGSNIEVAKADLTWNLVENDQPVNAVGKYLDITLKGNYYAIITDFAKNVTLSTADIAARKMVDKTFMPSEQTITLRKRSDHLNNKKDKAFLAGYQPIYIWPLPSHYTRSVVGVAAYATDALLILDTLSDVDLFY